MSFDNVSSKLAILFLACLACVLVLAWPTLRYPWYWDDYHLIREFSGSEIKAAFGGPWDLDGIESVSYRPLWVVANHVRAWLLGENLLAQRLALVSALALFTSLIGYCAHRAGLQLPYAVAGAIFALLAKSNHANLIWLTDMTHAWSGIPVALCGVLRSRQSADASARLDLVIFGLALAGLLVREDIAALFPLVVASAAFRWKELNAASGTERGLALRRAMLAVAKSAVPLVASLAVYFLARRTFVHDAVSGFNPAGMGSHIKMTFLVAGTQLPRMTRLMWCVFAGLVLAAAVLGPGSRRALRAQVLTWLVCALIACAPGLVTERSNLLMVPTTLFCLALAMGLQSLASSGAPRLVIFGAFVVWLGFARVSFKQTRKALLSGHPQSTETVQYAADFLYGRYAAQATIPAARRAFGTAYLKQFGIDSADSYNEAFPRLLRWARKRPKRPAPSGELFVPPSAFLAH